MYSFECVARVIVYIKFRILKFFLIQKSKEKYPLFQRGGFVGGNYKGWEILVGMKQAKQTTFEERNRKLFYSKNFKIDLKLQSIYFGQFINELIHLCKFILYFIHIADKEMATHSSILAWRILWTVEPGRLQSMGSQSLTLLSD